MRTHNPDCTKLVLSRRGAVIFDMDGVLVDSREGHYKAWRSFAHHHGISLTEQAFNNNIFGRRNRDVLPDLLACELTTSEVDALSDHKERLFRELIPTEVHLVPYCHKFIARLRELSVPLGLASSAPEITVSTILRYFNLHTSFEVIVTSGDIHKGKPDPESFIETARRLQTAIEKSVVFEDSPSGVRAGVNAGALVIGLSTTHEPKSLISEGARCVIPNFLNIDVVLSDRPNGFPLLTKN